MQPICDKLDILFFKTLESPDELMKLPIYLPPTSKIMGLAVLISIITQNRCKTIKQTARNNTLENFWIKVLQVPKKKKKKKPLSICFFFLFCF